MFKKSCFGLIVLAFFTFNSCDDDDTTQTNTGNNVNNIGDNVCKCQDMDCANCKTETSSCEDEAKLQLIYKIDGYFGNKHITEENKLSKKCPSGVCVQNDDGAHCEESN